MTPLLDYWLKVNLFLLLFYGCYWLLLRRNTFFTLNRTYLLGSVGLGLVLPFVHVPGLAFPWPWETSEPVYAVATADAVTVLDYVPDEADTPLLLDWPILVQWLFALVAVGLLGRIGWQVGTLLQQIRRWPVQAFVDHTLVLPTTDRLPTFSFFRYLVLNPADVQANAVRQHELVHIRQRHSVDVLLLEVLHALCWPNPVLFGYRQAIRQVHEYLADRDAVAQTASHRDAYAQFLVNYAFHLPECGIAADSLAHSFGPDRPDSPTLKQRIQMLYQQHTRRRALWKYALVLPLTTALLAMTSEPEPVTTSASTDELITTGVSMSLVSVSGRIEDSHGKPLPRVSISVKGNQIGTTTDAKGQFRLDTPANSVLIVSFTGFEQQEVTVMNKSVVAMSIILAERVEGTAPASLVHVEGYVYDRTATYPTSKPLSGANVTARADGKKTKTDAKGWFSIDVPANTDLVASSAGFDAQAMTVHAVQKRHLRILVFKLQPTTLNGSLSPEPAAPSSLPVPRQSQQGDDEVFTVVEQTPTFPGGMGKLFTFVNKNLRYPAAARRANVSGKVFVAFIVNADGRIDRPEILKGIGFGCDEEAIRLVKSMPNWIPGKQSGRPVAVKYNLPINFQLVDGKRAKVAPGVDPTQQKSKAMIDDPKSHKEENIDISVSVGSPNKGLSIKGVRDPLYILDGKEVDAEAVGPEMLSSDLIQKIDVLKDEAARAQYGEKGRNGIVRITTKAGVHKKE